MVYSMKRAHMPSPFGLDLLRHLTVAAMCERQDAKPRYALSGCPLDLKTSSFPLGKTK